MLDLNHLALIGSYTGYIPREPAWYTCKCIYRLPKIDWYNGTTYNSLLSHSYLSMLIITRYILDTETTGFVQPHMTEAAYSIVEIRNGKIGTV